MTFNKQTAHSTPIFANIQLLKIDGIRQLHLLTFVYHCQNKLASTYFHHYFVKCSQVHGYSTRLASCGDLFLQRKNTFQYGIRSIEYKWARLWNMIPSHIREVLVVQEVGVLVHQCSPTCFTTHECIIPILWYHCTYSILWYERIFPYHGTSVKVTKNTSAKS